MSLRSMGVEFPVDDDPVKLHGLIGEDNVSFWRGRVHGVWISVAAIHDTRQGTRPMQGTRGIARSPTPVRGEQPDTRRGRMSDQVIPISEVQNLATTIALIVAQALIQAKGDATGAIARLESVRGIEVGVADNGVGFQMDVIQAAQQSINAAAEMEAGDGT